jgi:hypothetical protein
MWAATHNSTLRERMTRVVDILYDCQKKMGTGYLSAYPENMFDLYEQLDEAWSPYYTIHKVRADQTLSFLHLFHPWSNATCVWYDLIH